MTRHCELILDLDTALTQKKSSIFLIEDRKTDKGDAVRVNTTQERIIIGLRSDIYKDYRDFGSGKYQKLVFSSVILPTLVEVLWNMKNNYNENDERMERRWYRVIQKKIATLNLSLVEDKPIEIAQRIFADPMGRALETIRLKSAETVET